MFKTAFSGAMSSHSPSETAQKGPRPPCHAAQPRLRTADGLLDRPKGALALMAPPRSACGLGSGVLPGGVLLVIAEPRGLPPIKPVLAQGQTHIDLNFVGLSRRTLNSPEIMKV